MERSGVDGCEEAEEGPNGMDATKGGRGVRVLVANEPNVYRAVISRVLREVRPHAEVVDVEPTELDAALRRLSPDLVVCSSLTPAVETSTSSWIELYPDGGQDAVVNVRGKRSALPAMSFDLLLSALDRVAQETGLPEAEDLSLSG